MVIKRKYEKKETKKKTIKKKKVIGMRYFISYTGKARRISLSGVGRIALGKEYEVRKEVADFLEDTKDWKVRRESVFEE